MKDIKSVMIGFLLATSMFLFMGQTSNDDSITLLEQALTDDFDREESKIGLYQGIISTSERGILGFNLVDTSTGEIYVLKDEWVKIEKTSSGLNNDYFYNGENPLQNNDK